MIKYKVSDIIRQAKSKADLQNSDFITHEDDIILLNDAWVELYQKSINAGEKYFINSIDVHSSVELPEDFFELESIYTENENLIARRKPNEHKTNDGYEIRNNTLYVYTDKPVIVNYWIKPETLTFPAEDISLTLPEEIKAVKKNYLFSDHYITNVKTKKSVKYNDFESVELFQVFDGLIALHDTENYKFYFYDIETLELVKELETNNLKPAQTMDRDIVFVSAATGKVYNFDEELIYETHQITTEDSNLIIYNEETHNITYLEGIYNYWIDDNIICYTDDKNYIKTLDFITEEIETRYSQRGFLLEENEKSGYGIYFNNKIKTISDDMELNYPSHLFYSALSYKLAIGYKIKQNEDSGTLQELYDEALITYFDTLQQDINENVRIKNVYGY